WQDEVAGTSLVTCKFSSSIFCWEELHKSQEGGNKNTKEKPWPLTLVLLLRASPLPFIATRGLTEENTFHGRIHGSIYGHSQRCNNADSPNSNVPCEH